MKALCVIPFCIGCLLASAVPASASVEIGQTFTPVFATTSLVFQVSSDPTSGAASYYGPYTRGVITSWRHQASPAGGSLRLKVVRPTGVTNEVLMVGESAVETLIPAASNTFQTRIPIAGGDLIGLRPTASIALIKTLAGSTNVVAGLAPGVDPITGTTATVAGAFVNSVVDVAATVEPDADADGFGDDTQDACPSDASTAGACPPPPDRLAPQLSGVMPFKLSKLLKKSTIEVSVLSNEAATATGTGTITVPGKKAYTLKQATVSVPAGGRATLKFKVPKKLLKVLRKKGRAKSQILVAVTDAAGNASRAEFPSKMKIVKTRKVIRR